MSEAGAERMKGPVLGNEIRKVVGVPDHMGT